MKDKNENLNRKAKWRSKKKKVKNKNEKVKNKKEITKCPHRASVATGLPWASVHPLILCIRREVYLSIIFSAWSTFPAKMDALLRMCTHLWYEMWKNETQLISK